MPLGRSLVSLASLTWHSREVTQSRLGHLDRVRRRDLTPLRRRGPDTMGISPAGASHSARAKSAVTNQEATIAQLKSTVAKHETTGAAQQKEIKVLIAGLQKVSAQIEISRPAPQTVLNDQ